MKMKPLHDRKGIKDIYKYYRSDNYATKEEKVTYKDFTEVCYKVNALLAERMLEGKYFKLPLGLGKFFIKKRRLNFDSLKFDYAHYNKTGQKAFFLNEHSNRFYAKWFWEKISCRVAGNSVYSFIPARTNKRALANVMQTPGGYKRFLE